MTKLQQFKQAYATLVEESDSLVGTRIMYACRPCTVIASNTEGLLLSFEGKGVAEVPHEGIYQHAEEVIG